MNLLWEQTIWAINKKWDELGIGDLIESPSLKFKPWVKGSGVGMKRELGQFEVVISKEARMRNL